MKVLKKMINILSHRERNQIYILLFAIIIMALVDMLGVASILPFMSVITNPELIETNIFLSYLYQKSEKLGVSNIKDFIFFLGCATFFLLIFSIFFKALTTYMQVRFILKVEYSLGTRLISGYLHQPYEWFLNRNSSELGKNILSQISQVTQGAMLHAINFIANCVVATALIMLIIATNPVLAFTMGSVFFFSYAIIYFFTRPLLKRKGSETVKANELRFKVVNEAFSAAKEVKVGRLENFYVKRFEYPAKIFTDNAAFSNILGLLPRYLLETVAFGGLILIVLILISRGENFNSISPTLALYALVGYRLLPALQAIYYATSQNKFSGAALDSLHKDLMNLNCYKKKETKIISMPIAKSIALKNVYFFYPNTKKVSLQDINFTIPAYTRVGIVGSTGSGKTTLVDVILGLLSPQQGKLFVDGNSITNDNKHSWQKSIGYVPQQIVMDYWQCLGLHRYYEQCKTAVRNAEYSNRLNLLRSKSSFVRQFCQSRVCHVDCN